MTERIRLQVSRETPALTLEAVLGDGERGGAVIAPPHPLYGGELGNPVVLAIERGLARHGIACLRFNFRGVGDSEGAPSGRPEHANADYAAALERLAAARPAPYVGAGYSFGAATAVRVAASDSRIARLVLVAPPLALLELAALRAFGKPVSVLVGDADSYAPLPALERALAGIAQLDLHVLPDQDHFFSTGTGELADRVAAALGRAHGITS